MIIAWWWTKPIQEDFFLGTAWMAPVLGPLPLFWTAFFSPLHGGILTLYSPSQLILTFHLLIRQVTTWVFVPSATFPHLLLIAVTKATLFRGPFPINAARTFVGAFNAEVTAFPWTAPTLYPRVRPTVLTLSFLQGSLWGLPLMACHSFLLGFGMPRTGSSSTTSLGHLDFRCMSSATSLLGAGLGP